MGAFKSFRRNYRIARRGHAFYRLSTRTEIWLCLVALGIGWLAYRWFRSRIKVSKYGERYVLITGCDSGFGNLLAKELDKLGFHVFAGCLTDKGSGDLNNETSSNVKTILLDVCNGESIQAGLETVKMSLPKDTGLWGVVNNAGVSGPPAPLEWCLKDDYEKTFAINTLGMIEMTRMFLPLVLKAQGRVVNMSSVVGRFALATGPYSVSKFAVEAYSDVLRREMYLRGVTVHIIEPGYFVTSISDPDKICDSLVAQYNKIPTELQEYYGKDYLEETKKLLKEGIKSMASPNVKLVVDAYTHALTAKYPNNRYLVGNDANYLFRLFWNLPEWIGDHLLTKGMPIPVKERPSK